MRLSPRRLLFTGAGFILLSWSLAKIFIYARNASLKHSLGAAALAWVSYLLIHRSETGTFIDPRKEEKTLPEHDENWIRLIFSATLFASGMIYGATGVSSGNFPQAFTGAALLLIGYFIAHFEFSDHIV
jgi:hypothetical protein